MPKRFVWFNVVAPKWRAPFRGPVPGLGGSRRWVRWQVVEEIRPYVEGEFVVSGYSHHSLHWTFRSAHRTAHAAQLEARNG